MRQGEEGGGDAFAVVAPWLESWRSRGWKVLPSHHADQLDLRVPMLDTGWRGEIQKAIAAGAISADLEPLQASPEFDEADRDAAAMFTLGHHGRLIAVPLGRDKRAGIAHIAGFDASRSCAGCGAGVVQTSDLRVAASELDRCHRMGSAHFLHNAFYLLADELVRVLQRAIGEPLPKRAIEATGKRGARQRWWQLFPEASLPPSAVRADGVTLERCAHADCGRLIVRAYATPSYLVHSVARSKLPSALPAVAWAPGWAGKLMHFEDGRIFAAPEPLGLVLRRDLGLALLAEGVHGLEIDPVLMDG